MTPQEAADALGSPLAYVRGPTRLRDLCHRSATPASQSFYPASERICLQFRRGRLTGWKNDWRMRLRASCSSPHPKPYLRSAMLPLSVLDLSLVTTGGSGPDRVAQYARSRRSTADGLGYTRYWVAEHHNLPSIASSAPDIMIGQIAAMTSHMRVGSGGVMLPNHAPLMVAERFKMLEALFPGRIDLGLGRAPGTDQITSSRCGGGRTSATTTISSNASRNCCCSRQRGFPDGHPFSKMRAMPQDVPLPPLCPARLVATTARSLRPQIGVGFSFAHHFASYDAADAMRPIAISFQPSAHWRSRMPFSAIAVVCADTDEEAERLAATIDLNFVRRAQGRVSAAREPGGGRGLSVHADRPRAHRAQPRAAVCRRADDRAARS